MLHGTKVTPCGGWKLAQCLQWYQKDQQYSKPNVIMLNRLQKRPRQVAKKYNLTIKTGEKKPYVHHIIQTALKRIFMFEE